MAYYLVRAKTRQTDLSELKSWLDSGEIRAMRPFGRSLDYSLNHARIAEDGFVVWEEEDYCSPPLAMEREAVIDQFFTDLSVQKVRQGEGWQKVEHLPNFWQT